MKLISNYESLLNEAKTMYALGHDNKYIEFQFADKGVEYQIIDAIISDIKVLRKSVKRRQGFKLLVYGASFIVVAFVFTLISYNSESPVRFVLWGLAVGGVVAMIKGIADIIGL